MENKENKKLYYLLLTAAIIIPIILAISYAYFQAEVYGSDPGVTGSSTTVFDVDLITENDGYINASNIILIEKSEINYKSQKSNFKVTSGANKYLVNYELSLSNLTISSNLQVSDFKWALLKNGVEIKNGSFDKVTANQMIIASDIQIGANKTDNFEFRLWIEESGVDQISLLNGAFSGKVSLSADMTDIKIP